MVANLKDDEQELLYTLLKKLGKSNES